MSPRLEAALTELRSGILRRWSEDVYQEVALQLLRRPHLDPEYPHAYVLKACLNVVRKGARLRTRETAALERMPRETVMAMVESGRQLDRAIARQQLAALDPRLINDALGGDALVEGLKADLPHSEVLTRRRVRKLRLLKKAKAVESKRLELYGKHGKWMG